MSDYSDLYLQAERLCYLVYLRASLSGDWGPMGENAQQVSFCYLLLDLSPDVFLTEERVDAYFSKINMRTHALGLSGLTLDEIDELLSSFKFLYKEVSYSIEELEELTELLGDSGIVFQGGFYGKTMEMICGEGVTCDYGDLKVTTITREMYRTPTVLLPIAAMISFRHVYVREVALRSIFYQKWVPFLTHDHTVSGEFGETYGAEIRRCADRSYPNGLLQNESLFVKDMTANVLQHELGHAVIQHHLLDIHTATVGEGVKMLGEQVLIDLLEILADIAPVYGEMSGPLWRLVNLAKIDLSAAQRQFWIYFSDAWFFDTPDTYMYGYSTYYALLMSRCIISGQVDFNALEEVLVCVLPLFLDTAKKVSDMLRDRVETTVYLIDDQRVNKLEFLAVEQDKNPAPEKFKDEPYTLLSWEYSKCLEYILESDQIDSLRHDLEGFRKTFDTQLVSVLFPNQHFSGSIKTFVFERLF